MSQGKNAGEKRLSPSASVALQELLDTLRKTLIFEAVQASEAEEVTDDDLYFAYKKLSYPSQESIEWNDAQAVITQAFKENRLIEWVSYVMAVVLFIFGLILVSIGAASNDVAGGIGFIFGGATLEVLILIPFRFAINSRRHNIALRMLGIIINRTHDPKKLSILLRETFRSVVLGESPPDFKKKSP